jgi:hypothetical protein
MKTNDAGMQSPSGMHFSDALLAQALTFVRLLEHAEGGLISAPEVVLQIRFGFRQHVHLRWQLNSRSWGAGPYMWITMASKAQVLYR